MFAFEIVGYAADGEAMCLDCADADFRKDAEPIFAGTEVETALTCDGCGEEIIEGEEKTRTITITEAGDTFITAEVEVTESEYAALQAASERGDRAFIEAWNERVQQEEDLDWDTDGGGDSYETVAIRDERGDELWYATDDAPAPPASEPPAATKDFPIIVVAEDAELLIDALDLAACQHTAFGSDQQSRLREYASVIREAAISADDCK